MNLERLAFVVREMLCSSDPEMNEYVIVILNDVFGTEKERREIVDALQPYHTQWHHGKLVHFTLNPI